LNNIDKYDKVFIECFSVDKAKLKKNLEYNSISQWDSVGHMSMIATLEEAFDVVFEMDDIIDFSSYNTGKEILKKYKINIT
jgi:acyl carrier protein